MCFCKDDFILFRLSVQFPRHTNVCIAQRRKHGIAADNHSLHNVASKGKDNCKGGKQEDNLSVALTGFILLRQLLV